MISHGLRFRVITALEAAGFTHWEDHLPVHDSGGTFSVVGSDRAGLNIWPEWRDAGPDELAGLRLGIVAALRAAGLEVDDLGSRLYVPRADRSPE